MLCDTIVRVTESLANYTGILLYLCIIVFILLIFVCSRISFFFFKQFDLNNFIHFSVLNLNLIPYFLNLFIIYLIFFKLMFSYFLFIFRFKPNISKSCHGNIHHMHCFTAVCLWNIYDFCSCEIDSHVQIKRNGFLLISIVVEGGYNEYTPMQYTAILKREHKSKSTDGNMHNPW